MARQEQGSHLMVQLQPHLRVCVVHGSICSRVGGTAGWGSKSLRAGAPALHPVGGCCVVPHPSKHPPTASRGLCAPLPCTRGSAVWGFSPQPRSPTLLSVPPALPPEVSVPPRGLPSLLLTDGLVLGICGWAGAEEETVCQGEKLGCCGWGALGVLGWELPALLAPVLGPWVCGPCGRSEISLSLGWVPGQRLGPVDMVPPPSTWDSGGEKAAWARGACQFVTLRRRGMA